MTIHQHQILITMTKEEMIMIIIGKDMIDTIDMMIIQIIQHPLNMINMIDMKDMINMIQIVIEIETVIVIETAEIIKEIDHQNMIMMMIITDIHHHQWMEVVLFISLYTRVGCTCGKDRECALSHLLRARKYILCIRIAASFDVNRCCFCKELVSSRTFKIIR